MIPLAQKQSLSGASWWTWDTEFEENEAVVTASIDLDKYFRVLLGQMKDLEEQHGLPYVADILRQYGYTIIEPGGNADG